MNTIVEIASRLSALCNERKFVDAYTELFSEHAESVDPIYKNEPLKGLTNLIEREIKFLASSEIHDIKVSEPNFAGNYFSVVISMDFTAKGRERMRIEELGVYKVENGKIVSQQFFIG
jgi:hypothetical protein